jgi:acylphosphatase
LRRSPRFGLIAVALSQLMSRQRMTVLYSGRVQGVGFRYTVKSITTGFEVTGTVRNLDDGRVEMIAEGEREELDAFRVAVRESGLGGLIQREEETFGAAQGQFRGFEIVR